MRYILALVVFGILAVGVVACTGGGESANGTRDAQPGATSSPAAGQAGGSAGGTTSGSGSSSGS